MLGMLAFQAYMLEMLGVNAQNAKHFCSGPHAAKTREMRGYACKTNRNKHFCAAGRATAAAPEMLENLI